MDKKDRVQGILDQTKKNSYSFCMCVYSDKLKSTACNEREQLSGSTKSLKSRLEAIVPTTFTSAHTSQVKHHFVPHLFFLLLI